MKDIEIFAHLTSREFIELCETGMFNGVHRFKPNEGKFDIKFVTKFIEIVRYEDDDYYDNFRYNCIESLADIGEFCSQMKCELSSHRKDMVIHNILESLGEILTRNPTNNQKEYNKLYSEIEYEIIMWSNDGTKTAGTLTRKILELIKTNEDEDN